MLFQRDEPPLSGRGRTNWSPGSAISTPPTLGYAVLYELHAARAVRSGGAPSEYCSDSSYGLSRLGMLTAALSRLYRLARRRMQAEPYSDETEHGSPGTRRHGKVSAALFPKHGGVAE